MTDDVGWEDHLAGHRMAVDREFADRVQQSGLTNGQWGLVMTAVDFEIESPDDPGAARLVADTSKLEHVLPEMRERGGGGAMPGGPTGGSSGGRGAGTGTGAADGEERSGGFLDRIKRSVVGGGRGDGGDGLESEAEALAAEYAELLQARLEEEGAWDEIRALARED